MFEEKVLASISEVGCLGGVGGPIGNSIVPRLCPIPTAQLKIWTSLGRFAFTVK